MTISDEESGMLITEQVRRVIFGLNKRHYKSMTNSAWCDDSIKAAQ